MDPRIVMLVSFLAVAASLPAQMPGSAPVLSSAPEVNYPPIAKAAHVSGEVIVRFTIATDGSTYDVQLVSGPPMLQGAVLDKIKEWRFHVPLPVNAQDTFEGHFRFTIDSATPAEQPDDLDKPPVLPPTGDDLSLPRNTALITSEVRSLDGSQTIDTTPRTAPFQACTGSPQPGKPPADTTLRDYIELVRTCAGNECRAYRVRIVRDGAVQWTGLRNVAVGGLSAGRMDLAQVQRLFDRIDASTFWQQCQADNLPRDEVLNEEDTPRGTYLTVQLGDQSHTVDLDRWNAGRDDGTQLAWIVDRWSNTHQWRHGDTFSEPWTNMYDDVAFPKPGITILIRALFRTNFNCCDQLLANLQKLIASGVDVNEADDSGWTPLMYAVRLTYDGRIKQALLDAHADVNRSSLRGDTALILSAWSGVLETDLLARGARINAHNLDGVTPLMLLAQRGDPKALKAALAAGADANAKDNTGRTALDYLRAAACHTPIIPLEPAAPEYDDDGNPKPPRVWPCPSTDPGAVQDEAILRAAMHSQSAR